MQKSPPLVDAHSGNTLVLEEAVPRVYEGTHVFLYATDVDSTNFVSGFFPKKELREVVLDMTGPVEDQARLPEVCLDGDGDWAPVWGTAPAITGYIFDTNYNIEQVEEAARFLQAVAAAKRKREAVLASEEFQSMKRFIEAFEEAHRDIFEQGTEKLAQALVEAGFRPPVDEA